MDDSLRLIVQGISRIPTLPVIAQEVLSLISNDSVSVARLEGVIENDPPIASRVLSVSNSAFFGTEVPNTTVGNAIVRIGFDNVRNIALGIALLTMFGNGGRGRPLDTKRIFKHSLSVGLIAKFLAERFRFPDRDELFLCGMLHDLGILAMNCYFSDLYYNVVDEIKNETCLLAAEKKVLGFTHTDVGAWLADKWNLPDSVSAAIRFHHGPLPSQDRQVALIHLSDYISSKNFFSATDHVCLVNPDYSVFDMLEFSPDDMSAMETTIAEEGIFSGGVFVYE
jgi:putative nucleotidyltransferase with HDIG domain